jgi:hypothetical protein
MSDLHPFFRLPFQTKTSVAVTIEEASPAQPELLHGD